MNKLSPKLLLPLAALIILFIAFAALGSADGLMALALPFTLLGNGLRYLSLSGSAGNIASIILYAVISLLPLAYLLRGKRRTEDLLLVVCSALLFYVLYFMINPALRPVTLRNEVGDLILSGVVYSALISWAIVKLMRRCDSMETGKIYSTLRIFLGICCAGSLLAVAIGFHDCAADIAAVKAANTAPSLDLTPTFVFTILAFAASALEYGLIIFILLLATKFLKELEADPYSQECHLAASRVTLWCKRSLVIVTLTGLALQISQLLFAPLLRDLAVNFRIPVVSMAVAFALLALTRLLDQGKQLKDDNDLFI